MDIKEKLLKDSYQREAPMSMDVTKVLVDTRLTTHDILKVWIRLMPAGQLVTDKADSITLARRLIPDSLRIDREPVTLLSDFERIAEAYFTLLLEARTAVSCRDVQSLAAYLKKAGDAAYLDLPVDFRSRLADRIAGNQASGSQLDSAQLVPNSD